jgi:hypothetical protein
MTTALCSGLGASSMLSSAPLPGLQTTLNTSQVNCGATTGILPVLKAMQHQQLSCFDAGLCCVYFSEPGPAHQLGAPALVLDSCSVCGSCAYRDSQQCLR